MCFSFYIRRLRKQAAAMDIDFDQELLDDAQEENPSHVHRTNKLKVTSYLFIMFMWLCECFCA